MNIHLNLTVDETNTILNALAELPFKSVHGLIGKIQNDANEQLKLIHKIESSALEQTNPPKE